MDGKKWRMFIRWLWFDDLMTSYTDAGPRSWGGLRRADTRCARHAPATVSDRGRARWCNTWDSRAEMVDFRWSKGGGGAVPPSFRQV